MPLFKIQPVLFSIYSMVWLMRIGNMASLWTMAGKWNVTHLENLSTEEVLFDGKEPATCDRDINICMNNILLNKSYRFIKTTFIDKCNR